MVIYAGRPHGRDVAVRPRTEDPIALQLLCEVCGKRIVLAPGEAGVTVDRAAFLEAHRDCLQRRKRPAAPSH